MPFVFENRTAYHGPVAELKPRAHGIRIKIHSLKFLFQYFASHASAAFVIAFVGSFIPRKGPDRVAKAIAKLNDTRIKVMFIGQESSGYNYLFECSGIIYKGPVTHEKLPIMLNCADVFVLPTRNEGCSNAIVEALACGIPVISSNGAFNDDILDNRNSIRIDADDIDALADAIAFLQHNPKVRQTMREFSISRHHSYSIENRAGKILGFIESNIQKD